MADGKMKPAVVVLSIVGGCCVLTGLCGVFGALLPKQPAGTASAPTAAAPASIGAAPGALPLAPAEAMVTLPDGSVCNASLDRLAANAPEARWPILRCAWDARPDESNRLEVAYGVFQASKRGPAPAEHRGMAREALELIGAHPALITPGVSLFAATRPQLVEAGVEIQTLIEMCPRCARIPATRDRKGWLTYWIEHFPVPVDSVEAYQLRHDDLRERPARLHGYVTADTYYNCKYQSTSTWRAMTFSSDSGAFAALAGMHVYCRAGEEPCERLYSAAVQAKTSGDDAEVDLVLEYPRSNRICEEDQAEVVQSRIVR